MKDATRARQRAWSEGDTEGEEPVGGHFLKASVYQGAVKAFREEKRGKEKKEVKRKRREDLVGIQNKNMRLCHI